ncbi:hypothetical protein [Pseudomonas silesiensis]
MKTIIESTALDDQYRARRLPPDLLGRTNALLDELEWSRAEVRRLKAIGDKKAAAMRAARTAKLEALVTAAIQAKRARLEKEPRHRWTSTLMVHYFDKRKITIDEETVRRVVYSFPGF